MIGANRRSTELGLIILAVAVVGAAYVLASLGTEASLPANIVPFLGVIFALLIGAHVAVRKLAPLADGILLPLAALLNGLGYVWIARLDQDLAGLQATWSALGILGFVLTLAFVRRMRDLDTPYTLMIVGVGLLLLPLVPGVGRTINGAQIWVSIGPMSFQPGEFAKIALAISFAAYLVRKREVLSMATFKIGPLALPEPRDLGPVMLAWGFSLLVMFFEKDLGSSLLFFALFITMVWIATQRAAYLVIGTVLFSAGAFFAWRTFGHVQTRIDVWLDPWQDVSGKGFQVVQSWFSLAAGGVTGKGPGLGQPDLIPAADTDFIFAAIGEELGLLGGSLILVAFLLMVGAGLRIALTADREFDKLLAAGLTTLLGIQAFIIIGGVTRLLPLTGVTLPFISYGGSSLVANYVLLALLLRISDDSTRRINEGRVNQAAAA
ncbi:MAG TPA: FtsW/RodA/SpoVE family cell cycle protein [Acidimicrobiales bacterium]|nr:FtsW/RodA/SpoVE family cell cycle protein [Acidimicrobiales bacterium]